MTTINSKMGFRPAGKRSMMHLPRTLAERNAITSAKCPQCQHTGAWASKTKGPGWLYCTWCNHVFAMPAHD